MIVQNYKEVLEILKVAFIAIYECIKSKAHYSKFARFSKTFYSKNEALNFAFNKVHNL